MIDRRVRELKVVSDILPLDTSATKLREAGYKGIIISGGPNSVYDQNAPEYDSNIFGLGIPILGVYTLSIFFLFFLGFLLFFSVLLIFPYSLPKMSGWSLDRSRIFLCPCA